MAAYHDFPWALVVTLHTEGVDRNDGEKTAHEEAKNVTLHTEGVDRNWSDLMLATGNTCHPPHGGCG